jgi:3'-phosphoadenosine 5'-phosphosulfate sulfotransferase (PAPS reductase)/FAD synthetase
MARLSQRKVSATISEEQRRAADVMLWAAHQRCSVLREQGLALAFEMDSARLGISFSGAEHIVLVDTAAKLGAKLRFFSLDTGRLHAETLRFLEQVRERYQIPIEVFFLPGRKRWKSWSGKKAPSPFTRTDTRNVAASARWNRCGKRLAP